MTDLLTSKNTEGVNFETQTNTLDPLSCIRRVPPPPPPQIPVPFPLFVVFCFPSPRDPSPISPVKKKERSHFIPSCPSNKYRRGKGGGVEQPCKGLTSHPGKGGLGILLVTCGYGNQTKLWPNGQRGLYADFILPNSLFGTHLSPLWIPWAIVNLTEIRLFTMCCYIQLIIVTVERFHFFLFLPPIRHCGIRETRWGIVARLV